MRFAQTKALLRCLALTDLFIENRVLVVGRYNTAVFDYNVPMLETILRTKLYVPPLRPNLVPRRHLIERLNQGLQSGHKLTLVSAPAGFGKSTLVCQKRT